MHGDRSCVYLDLYLLGIFDKDITQLFIIQNSVETYLYVF